MDDTATLNGFLQGMEDAGEYERAAAVAVFHQDIRRGIEALTKGAAAAAKTGADNGGFLSAAMALSGYSVKQEATAGGAGRAVSFGAGAGFGGGASNDTLWKETCAAIRTRLYGSLPSLSACTVLFPLYQLVRFSGG
jgi:hypothetical protein